MSGEPPQFLEERHARLLVVDSLDPSNRSLLTAPMSRSSLRSPITEPRSKTSSEKNRPRAWTNELEVPPPGLHRDTTSRPLNSVCLLHDLNLGRFSLLSPDLYAFPLIPTVEFYKRGTRPRASQSPRALESRLDDRPLDALHPIAPVTNRVSALPHPCLNFCAGKKLSNRLVNNRFGNLIGENYSDKVWMYLKWKSIELFYRVNNILEV